MEAPPEEGVSLEEFTELVAGGDSPAARAACWCWLQQSEQHLFRWRQGRVHPRSLRDLRQLRHDRHRRVLDERRVQHWHGLLSQRTPLIPAELDPAQSQHQCAQRQYHPSPQDDLDVFRCGILDVVEGGLKIVELAEGVSEAELRAATEATLVG